MILTRKLEKAYKMDVNKGIFARICKEVQLKSKLKIIVSSHDDDMVASAIIPSISGSYILNLCMINKSIRAFLLEPSTMQMRYCTELKTYKFDSLGEMTKCDDSDIDEYIDNFVSEIISMCR